MSQHSTRLRINEAGAEPFPEPRARCRVSCKLTSPGAACTAMGSACGCLVQRTLCNPAVSGPWAHLSSRSFPVPSLLCSLGGYCPRAGDSNSGKLSLLRLWGGGEVRRQASCSATTPGPRPLLLFHPPSAQGREQKPTERWHQWEGEPGEPRMPPCLLQPPHLQGHTRTPSSAPPGRQPSPPAPPPSLLLRSLETSRTVVQTCPPGIGPLGGGGRACKEPCTPLGPVSHHSWRVWERVWPQALLREFSFIFINPLSLLAFGAPRKPQPRLLIGGGLPGRRTSSYLQHRRQA